jgi:hypothetical protein
MSCLNARGVKWLGRVILKEERSLHRSGVPHEGAEAAEGATPSHPFNHTSFTAKSSGGVFVIRSTRDKRRQSSRARLLNSRGIIFPPGSSSHSPLFVSQVWTRRTVLRQSLSLLFSFINRWFNSHNAIWLESIRRSNVVGIGGVEGCRRVERVSGAMERWAVNMTHPSIGPHRNHFC